MKSSERLWGDKMTRKEEIEFEIVRLAKKLYPQCVALFELPKMIYVQIMIDNDFRKKPYRVSFERIQRIVGEMMMTPIFDEIDEELI